jgi:hypothetical protein
MAAALFLWHTDANAQLQLHCPVHHGTHCHPTQPPLKNSTNHRPTAQPPQVNWTVMKEWVAKRVTELLGIEEEVLISMIHNHLIDQVGLI